MNQSSMTPVKFATRRVVLAEGADDVAIVNAMIAHEELSNFYVHNMDGIPKWSAKTHAIAQDAEFKANVRTLGMIVDADKDYKAAWNRCVDALKRAGFPVPKDVTTLQAGSPTTSILILPGKNKDGMLEDLCLEASPSDATSCVDGYFKCLESKGLTSPSTSKAKIQVYLAGLAQPRRALNHAATAGDFDMGHPAFDQLRLFLRDLGTV